ncbi:MAG: hypothetical protein AAFR61_27615 [Bacteroidota bacterium]
MKRKIGIWLFILGWAMGLPAQSSWGISVSAGVETGFWIFNKGFDQDQFHQGYDRTYLLAMVPLQLGLQKRWDRLHLGLQGGYHTLYGDDMISSAHRTGRRQIYRIAPFGEYVTLFDLSVRASYRMIKRGKYGAGPMLRLGTFWLQHTHPQADDIGLPLQGALGVEQAWTTRHWEFRLTGHGGRRHLFPKAEAAPGTSHDIYHLGLLVSLVYTWGAPKH